MTYILIINFSLWDSVYIFQMHDYCRANHCKKYSTHDIPCMFCLFMTTWLLVGGGGAKPSFLYVYLDNRTVCLIYISILFLLFKIHLEKSIQSRGFRVEKCSLLPQICLERRLNGALLRIRPCQLRSRVIQHAGMAR